MNDDVIYLDSSAAVKLVHQERETTSLQDWLTQYQGGLVLSSELALTEVLRTLRRNKADDRQLIVSEQKLLQEVNLVEITRDIIRKAGRLPGDGLRSLDAIHLATAEIIGTVSVFVTYDKRLSQYAEARKFSVSTPGA